MELIQEIGSYAGFAAVLGLAVLSALYFSQARDVRRLRDWAGRAPERDAEARSRVAAATNLAQTPAAQAQQGQAAYPAAKPAAAGASGNSGGAATPAPAKAGVAAGAAGGSGGGGGARPAVASPARPARVSAQTSILKPEDQPRERWYRRVAPRYIALIVAGVLVVGGGIAVGALQLLGDDGGGTSGTTSGTAARGENLEPKQNTAAPVRPSDINVAVLNATTSQGLATQFGDQVQGEGFQKGSVGNYEGPQRAESVVMFAPSRQAEARLVRRKFDISAIEAADESARRTAPSADVIVVIGADKAGG